MRSQCLFQELERHDWERVNRLSCNLYFSFISSLRKQPRDVGCRREQGTKAKTFFSDVRQLGSGLFSFLSGIFAQIFGQIVSIIRKRVVFLRDSLDIYLLLLNIVM